MARILAESLVPGMRLTKPLLNAHGVLLLKAGDVLTEKHMKVLMAWGVREVDVVREDGEEPEASAEAALPATILAATQGVMARRFRRVDPVTDPFIEELQRVVTLLLARRKAAEHAMRPQNGREAV